MSAGDYHLLDMMKGKSLFTNIYFTEEYLADDKLGYYVYERIIEQGY
jgi:hypothetical protein